ncbi:11378_t:CDS:1, partial [Gigaspora margarita]
IQFERYSNCHLNSKRIQHTCTIEVLIIFSTQFLGQYSIPFHINLHANLIDLICSAAIKHPLTIPQLPSININNKIVSNIFHPNQATTTLQQIALNNAI